MKVAVGYSGGVDSTYAALDLKRAGHEVLCLTLDLHEGVDLEKARASAKANGLEWEALPCRNAFKKITDQFFDYYARGLTPNPCLYCNQKIKFGFLLDAARERGCERLATGHYARAVNGRIHKAVDASKDQSYAFALVKKEALPFILLPMGGKEKAAVKRALNWKGGESQDLCFATSRLAALEEKLPKKKGVFLYNGKQVGEHDGAWFYCIGQRRGVGSERLFVKEVNVKDNFVVLAKRSELFCSSFTVRGFNLHGDLPEEVDLIVRHRQETVRARVEGNRFTPLAPLWAPAPGQVAGVYDGDLLIGGGIIDLVDYENAF